MPEQAMKPFSTAYQSDRIKLVDAIPLSVPLCVSLEPTNICNFRCLMCWQGMEEYRHRGGPFMNMSADVFHKALQDMEDICAKGGSLIKLVKLYFAGEPLLNKNIGEMLRELKEAGVCQQVEVTTNASLLSAELSRAFVDYGLDYLRASIYSVYTDNHRRITQTEVPPNEIRDNIAYLRKYRDEQNKQKPYISAKIIDTHSEENDQFKEFYSGVSDEAWIDVPWDVAGTQEKALDRLYGSEGAGFEARKEYHETSLFKKRKACRYPFTHLVIKSNGDVVVCCMDWPRQTKLGNIMEESLVNIWEGKKLYDFRVMQLKTHGAGHPLCGTCEVPLRDCAEDDIDTLDIRKLTYTGEEME